MGDFSFHKFEDFFFFFSETLNSVMEVVIKIWRFYKAASIFRLRILSQTASSHYNEIEKSDSKCVYTLIFLQNKNNSTRKEYRNTWILKHIFKNFILEFLIVTFYGVEISSVCNPQRRLASLEVIFLSFFFIRIIGCGLVYFT